MEHLTDQSGLLSLGVFLPLVGVALTNLLPITARTNQFLVMVTLIWFQVFILFEVFSGK